MLRFFGVKESYMARGLSETSIDNIQKRGMNCHDIYVMNKILKSLAKQICGKHADNSETQGGRSLIIFIISVEEF
jgi:hypothetical protein